MSVLIFSIDLEFYNLYSDSKDILNDLKQFIRANKAIQIDIDNLTKKFKNLQSLTPEQIVKDFNEIILNFTNEIIHSTTIFDEIINKIHNIIFNINYAFSGNRKCCLNSDFLFSSIGV